MMSEWLKLWNHMHSFSGSFESTQEQPWRKLIFHNPWVVDLQADSWWERSTLVAWVAPFCSLVPLSTEIHLSHHQFLVVLTPPTVPLASPLKKRNVQKNQVQQLSQPISNLGPCTLHLRWGQPPPIEAQFVRQVLWTFRWHGGGTLDQWSSHGGDNFHSKLLSRPSGNCESESRKKNVFFIKVTSKRNIP